MSCCQSTMPPATAYVPRPAYACCPLPCPPPPPAPICVLALCNPCDPCNPIKFQIAKCPPPCCPPSPCGPYPVPANAPSSYGPIVPVTSYPAPRGGCGCGH